MSSQPETPEQRFLETIADSYGFLGDRRLAFVNRFSQSNASIENAHLARKILWNSDKVDLSSVEKKLRDELSEIYRVLREKEPDGPLPPSKRGRPSEGNLWKQVYPWLWETKFPDWQQEQSISPSKKLTTSSEQQKEALFCFLEKVEKKFNSIYLFHLQQPISLTDQYIPIQVMLDPRRKDTESSWGYIDSGVNLKQAYALKGSGDQSRQTPVDWTQVRSQYSRLIVLADPGMGKTTLLNQEVGLATQETLEKLRNNQATVEEAIIPMFIRLPDLAKTAGELFDAIPDLIQRDYQQFATPILSLLQEKLKNGTCRLFLDALDEVPRDHRKDLIEKLDRFAQNSSCAMTVTSRIVGYNSELRHFAQEVEIVPFNEKQRNQYIKTWFRNAAGYLEDKSVTPEGLIRELEDKPQIAGLAQNPLLLSLICSLYQTKGLTLPTRRSQVYEQAVEFVLGKWRHQRKPITEGRIRAKMRLLEHLAYLFFSNEQDIFSADELYNQIEKYLQNDKVPTAFKDVSADNLFTELSEEDGIIQKLDRESNRYIFLHRSFQEYFTAKQLADENNLEVKIQDVIEKHLFESQWYEVFFLISEVSKRTDKLVLSINQEINRISARSARIRNLLSLIYEWFPHANSLSQLEEFKKCSYIDSLPWLPIIRAICLESIVEHTHDISLSLKIKKLNEDIGLKQALSLYQEYNYFKVYELATVLESNLEDASFEELDSVQRLPVIAELRRILHPIKYLMDYVSPEAMKTPLTQYISLDLWWKVNGQNWNTAFRNFLSKNRLALVSLELNSDEKLLLKQYYDANKLLVNCMKVSQELGSISPLTVKKIEEEFLLFTE